MGVEVGGERLRVEGGGVGRVPGGVERDLEGGEIQVEHAGDAIGGSLGVRGRDETDVEVPPAVAQLDPLPLRVGGERRHPQLGGQRRRGGPGSGRSTGHPGRW